MSIRVATVAVLSALALQLPARAATHPARFVLVSGSQVAYHVDVKTLGLLNEHIDGVDQAVRGEVDLTPGRAPTGWAEADVAGFHSGITSRDHHVARMLGLPALPTIHFALARLEGYHADVFRGSAVAVGTLRANGHAREVHVPLTYVRDGDVLRVEGEAPLRFRDFGIDPPVLGLVFKRAPELFTIRVALVAHEVREAF